MQIRHFRRFRQNGPFLAGDKNKVYQKHGLCDPEKVIEILRDMATQIAGHPGDSLPKQQKMAPCTKLLSGTSHGWGQGYPDVWDLVFQEYPVQKLFLSAAFPLLSQATWPQQLAMRVQHNSMAVRKLWISCSATPLRNCSSKASILAERTQQQSTLNHQSTRLCSVSWSSCSTPQPCCQRRFAHIGQPLSKWCQSNTKITQETTGTTGAREKKKIDNKRCIEIGARRRNWHFYQGGRSNCCETFRHLVTGRDHIYIYIYIYAVELLSGPRLGVFNSY